jgi:hypothetical protein
MPENQAVARKTTQFNQKFAEIVESCRPKLHARMDWTAARGDLLQARPDDLVLIPSGPSNDGR